MFKSIQYKLYVSLAALILSVAALTYCIFFKEYLYAIIAFIVFIISLIYLNKSIKKFNQNILFLLNALDNGDYSFHFSETKLSRRERELNKMLNRIKEILTNARKQVIENEKFLSVIVESVSTGIIIVDNRGIVHTTNKATLSLLGIPVFTHLNQLQNINENLPKQFLCLQVGDTLQMPIVNEREELQISVHVSEIKTEQGHMKVMILTNIGNELEMKEMESWIRLIRVMTHEIMNSISPITSLSDTLLSLLKSNDLSIDDKTLKNNTIEAFDTISTTAKGLLSFVESYRKFTSIPKPQVQLFSLNSLVTKILKLYETQITNKDIKINILKSNNDTLIHADEKLIGQVLTNLLKNAIEATGNTKLEEIDISINDNSSEGNISIAIANTGPLISEEVLPHIFVPFYTTKENGSGIGLSVARYIMRLHGGKLQHYVSKDQKTVFVLTFYNK